jgi:hypothetical protein
MRFVGVVKRRSVKYSKHALFLAVLSIDVVDVGDIAERFLNTFVNHSKHVQQHKHARIQLGARQATSQKSSRSSCNAATSSHAASPPP